MAMVMTGEVQLPASREIVYAKLNDAEVLKACIPGCEELNKISDTELQAVAVTKIGRRGSRQINVSDVCQHGHSKRKYGLDFSRPFSQPADR